MVSAGPRLIVSVFSAFGLSDRISVRRALSPPTQDGFSRPPPYRLCILPSASQTGSAPSAWSVSKPRPPNGSDVSFLVISPSRPYSVSCGRPPDETPHLPDSFGPCSIARPRQVNCPIGWLRCRFWRAGTRPIPPRLRSPPSWRRSRRCLSVTPAVPELLLMAPFSSH